MRWQDKLAACTDNVDRALLARNPDCDLPLLRIFCEEDLDPMVVEEAALNPNSSDHWVARAIERFPELNTEEFWKTRTQNELLAIEKEGSKLLAGDRDQIIKHHILKESALDHASAHLGEHPLPTNYEFKNPNREWDPTSKYRVAMIMAPSWGILFPPYNLAKLVGILRAHDYSTKVYDLNIESYHQLISTTGEDYWRGERYFLWTIKENFIKFILPHVKPLFDKIVDELVESNPRVIGFSIYSTNLHATTYLVKEIRRRMPTVCIVGGGPEVVTTGQTRGPFRLLPFNYLFVGEAEEVFLSTLENLPDVLPSPTFLGNTDSKLKLESYPFADYSDYKLENYQQRGLSIETSRGCVAQCSFCAETYFWKFRSTQPERVVEEMEHQIKTTGAKRFWFVDSLVNGNLKNFERLIDLIIEKKLKIQWNSYARCDGRMSKEFMNKIAASGCTCLSFGVESGSQKVLHDMRKKIEIWEIENNLKDGFEAGIFNHVNWMMGFPTEEPIDYLHSIQLIANSRKHIDAISPGFGAGPASQSHMETDWRTYGMVGERFVAEQRFLNTWYTDNYQNTILHRFLRVKMFHVWLDILESYGDSIIQNGHYHSNIAEFYKFSTPTKATDYVSPDEYVKLDRRDSNDFGNSITNEYYAMFYALYLYFGAYTFEFMCDPTIDKNTFGTGIVNNYTAKVAIEVDASGNYNIDISHTFIHDSLNPIFDSQYTHERQIKDQGFNLKFNETGNIKDWKSDQIQTKETVHEQYRKKSKKVIPITPL